EQEGCPTDQGPIENSRGRCSPCGGGAKLREKYCHPFHQRPRYARLVPPPLGVDRAGLGAGATPLSDSPEGLVTEAARADDSRAPPSCDAEPVCDVEAPLPSAR